MVAVLDDNGKVKHPEYIVVQVLQNGKAYGDPIKIYAKTDSEGNEEWPVYHLDGLPEGYTYTIQEVKVPGYKSVITVKDNAFLITNTLTGFEVQKKWVDQNNKELTENLPEYIEVQLYKNGEPYGETVELTAADGWTYTWIDLPKEDEDGNPYVYTAKEVIIPDGYYSTGEGVNNDKGVCIITNVKSPVTSISVEKKWENDVVGADSVTVDLLQNGQKYRESAVLNTGNGWFYKWNDLPVYDKNGKEVTYEVVETPVEGYTSDVTEGDTTLKTYTWKTAESFKSGTKYLLVSNDGALGADSNGNLKGVDVSTNISEGTLPEDNSVLWEMSSSKLKNGNGNYLYLGDDKFIASNSGTNINYSGQKLYAEKWYVFWTTKYYIADLTGAVVEDSGGLDFTLYERVEGSLDYGDLHYVVTNSKKTGSIDVNFAKYSTGDDELILLAGAELKLYKRDDEGEVIPGTDVKGTYINTWTSETAVSESDGIHTEELSTGTYYLVETDVPEGHMGLAGPIIFNVDAEGDTVTITSYPGYEEADTLVNDDGKEIIPVYNAMIYELPETGGMGTAIFYLAGGLLLIGSVVLLVTRKRMK